MKILFISLGCDKNLVDTEMMLGQLSEEGFTFTDDEAQAEVIVVNTCCFINDAKEESINTILEMAELKKQGTLKALVVTGCLAQRYKEEIQTEIPEVDCILGTTAIDQIVEAVKEELGLTDEELNTILETLGLSQMDLLNVENIQAIVVATTGETDGLSILTDENLYQSLQQLTEVVETTVADLQNQLQVDETGFGDLLKQMEVNGEPEEAFSELTADKSNEQTPVMIQVSHGEAQQTAAEQSTDAAEELSEENQFKTSTDETGNLDAVKEQTEGLNEVERMEAREEGQNKKDSSEKENHAGTENHENGNTFLQGTIRTNADAWNMEALQGRMEMPFQQPDVENIMNQITEYMKIEANPDLTEMELQLQPEALGTVKIHMTAKEGVITAQFTTENESVKAVIEAQAVQLKENLNNQGIKVEAVEVTVANQGFNRSFAENGDSTGGYEEPKKKGVRRIQLTDEISIEDMELSEEDRIAAEMMEMNGNTVDYTA